MVVVAVVVPVVDCVLVIDDVGDDVAVVDGVVIWQSAKMPSTNELMACASSAAVVLQVASSPKKSPIAHEAPPTIVPRECSAIKSLIAFSVAAHSVPSGLSSLCCKTE